MTNCLCFGDSITYGEYDGELGGWVDILKRYFHKAYYEEKIGETNIFNLGKGGETTKGLIKRIAIETEARQSPEKNIIIIGYGANDLAFVKDKQQVSINEFEKNLAVAIKIAKQTTDDVFLNNILQFSQRIDGIESHNNKLRCNVCVGQYNDAITDVAAKNNIQVIDLHRLFSKNAEAWISKDGIHPNATGYSVIAEHVKSIIQPLI